jgi:hypothetical protein
METCDIYVNFDIDLKVSCDEACFGAKTHLISVGFQLVFS